MESIPVLIIFLVTIALIVVSIELGYKMGTAARKRSLSEKTLPVSTIAGSILGMLGFILAFTFSIVANRFDAKKTLVREEANAIGTAWLRSQLLPDAEHIIASKLYKEYLDIRLNAGKPFDEDEVPALLKRSTQIQRSLWHMALVNAKRDLNSDAGALYFESVNKVIDIHALRVSKGLQARLPWAIWVVFYALTILGMLSIGYETAMASAERTWAIIVLSLSFSFVIILIALMDRSQSKIIPVSQQPLIDVRASMKEDN
jgi:CDP-diglyceride synthetase